MPSIRTSTQALAAAALLAVGAGSAVALAEPGRDHAEDDGTTTAETTTTTGTTTTQGQTTRRAPRIDEIEVDALSGGRLRLEAETSGRVTRLRFTYRGRSYAGRRGADGDWSRVVRARGGDGNDSVIRLRVRACNGDRCTTRTGRDDA